MRVEDGGVCIWITGLCGSGKSTTAHRVGELLTMRGRHVTILDGDQIRATISRDLGFSKTDRATQVHRVAALAREGVSRGDMVICALVSPHREARDQAKVIVGAGQFVEVFMDTPLEVCEARDPKGLYARARRGQITDLTGVDTPYEAPTDADVVLTTTDHTIDENARRVVAHLVTTNRLRA